jgi:3-methyladenine DNA glycosylase Mpg
MTGPCVEVAREAFVTGICVGVTGMAVDVGIKGEEVTGAIVVTEGREGVASPQALSKKIKTAVNKILFFIPSTRPVYGCKHAGTESLMPNGSFVNPF